MSDTNIVIFGYEVQHILASEIWTSDDIQAQAAAALLNLLGITEDAKSNKIALLRTPATRDAFAQNSIVSAILARAGFGLNTHNSINNPGATHPGYNVFEINTLAQIAGDDSLSQQAKKYKTLDFIRFIEGINKSSTIPVQGTPESTFTQAYKNYIGNINYNDAASFDAAAIDAYARAYDFTSISNTQFRYETSLKLRSAASTVLSTAQIANASRNINLASPSGGNSGNATAGVVSILVDLSKLSSNNPIPMASAMEVIASNIYATISRISSGIDLDTVLSDIQALFAKIQNLRSYLSNRLESVVGNNTRALIARSAYQMADRIGSSTPGLAILYIDQIYDALKKGVLQNDWSDFIAANEKFGSDFVSGMAMIISITIGAVAAGFAVAGAAGAAAASEFIAAFMAGVGFVAVVVSGADLISKLVPDVIHVMDNAGAAVQNLLQHIRDVANDIMDVYNTVSDDSNFTKQFAFTSSTALSSGTYLIDPFDITLPDKMTGSAADEVFFGKNTSTIEGGDGDDEIYVRGTSEAHGGKGEDIVAGAKAVVIHAGQPLDPNDPSHGVATAEMQMRLDGGEGDDWVMAFSGDDAITVGGLGRDVIYNKTTDGIIWGDVENSILDPATDQRYYLDENGRQVFIKDDASNADNFVWSAGTTIEDPQFYDILTFDGIPLANPVDNGGALLSLVGFGLGGMTVSMSQIYKRPIDTVYNDEILPFITYAFKPGNNGAYDLVVSDVLTAFLNAIAALGGVASSGSGGLSAAVQQYLGANASQLIKDYIPAINQGQVPVVYRWMDDVNAAKSNRVGKLGMVFKKSNPIDVIQSKCPSGKFRFASKAFAA